MGGLGGGDGGGGAVKPLLIFTTDDEPLTYKPPVASIFSTGLLPANVEFAMGQVLTHRGSMHPEALLDMVPYV